MVELEGLKPSTSSMPWKHSNQLSYSPISIGVYQKLIPVARDEPSCCYAPTRGTFCERVCFTLRKGYPFCAPAIPPVCPSLYSNTSIFVVFIVLILVITTNVCLNNSVQKHTRIKAKGGRLPLKQVNSLLRNQSLERSV